MLEMMETVCPVGQRSSVPKKLDKLKGSQLKKSQALEESSRLPQTAAKLMESLINKRLKQVSRKKHEGPY